MRDTKAFRNMTLLAAAAIAAVMCLSAVAQSSAAADDVSVYVSPPEISINNTEIGFVDLIISNNRNFADTLSLSVWPSTTWAGITPNLDSYNVKVDANSNVTVKLYFSVAADADMTITNFLVTAKSVLFENVSSSKSVNVRTLRKTSVYISDVFVDRYVLNPTECMNIRTDVTNLGLTTESYKLSTIITKEAGTVHRFDDDLLIVEGKSIGSAAHSYCVGKHMQWGKYTLSTTLKTTLNRLVDTRSVNFEITEKSDLIYEKSVAYTPFAQIKTITVKNDGNRVERDFYVTETVSDFVSKLFYPVTTPTSTETADGKMVYSWKIGQLNPGDETSVTYEIRFVSIWFSGLVIALVVFLAFTYVYTPRIGKGYTMMGPLKRGKEIHVLLELKNATLYEIRNIVVRDSIPPLASLVDKFDTMRPETKKSEAGTDLLWRIKSLKPFEERVLTYRIKTNVDVIGSIRLPRTVMEYINQKKQVRIVSSKAVELK
ncbi:MAG: hypothetical protein ABIA12_01025 [Candidatus Aenigmatarchaeota archaeon]